MLESKGRTIRIKRTNKQTIEVIKQYNKRNENLKSKQKVVNEYAKSEKD